MVCPPFFVLSGSLGRPDPISFRRPNPPVSLGSILFSPFDDSTVAPLYLVVKPNARILGLVCGFLADSILCLQKTLEGAIRNTSETTKDRREIGSLLSRFYFCRNNKSRLIPATQMIRMIVARLRKISRSVPTCDATDFLAAPIDSCDMTTSTSSTPRII